MLFSSGAHVLQRTDWFHGEATATAPPAASRAELDRLTSLGMGWGLTYEVAFVLGLQLRSSGITAQIAQAMFRDAEKRPLQ